MPSKTILLADDDPELVRLISNLCRARGFRVVRVLDGAEAACCLGSGVLPDVAVLDLHMPSLDGFEVLASLRDLPGGADVPVVVLTGRFDRATVRRCVELGAHYVHKGDELVDDLVPLIIELAGSREGRAGRPESIHEAAARVQTR